MVPPCHSIRHYAFGPTFPSYLPPMFFRCSECRGDMGHELGHLDAAYLWDRWSTTRSSQSEGDGILEETETEEMGWDSVGLAIWVVWGCSFFFWMIFAPRWATQRFAIIDVESTKYKVAIAAIG